MSTEIFSYNPYYSPEECGLAILGQIEDDEPYEFDILVVFKDKAGRLWMAHDSGCSCPTPFERIHGFGDLTEARTMADFDHFVMSLEGPWPVSDVFNLRRKVKEVLK